ncbi:MAG: hypothetical protein KUG78_15080 [Kangiellaceae bacterium]|nr:hypothetical protein [Kangiellaceae bacterium]
MPRASRSFIPNQIWHVTHRCHIKEFLLKFKRDRKRLCELTGVNETNQLSQVHARWVNDALTNKSHQRDEKWTTSVAVGSHAFAESYMEKAGGKVSYRKMKVSNGCTIIKEPEVSYAAHL